MSQGSFDATVIAYQADLIDAFTVGSTTALVAYECILTASQEVTMIWRRRWTPVTWLFIVNRYLTIANTILGVAPSTAQSCPPGVRLYDIICLMQYMVFAVFSALRVFAIWDRDLPMTLLVLMLNLTPIAINAYTDTQEKSFFTVGPVLGTYCGYVNSIPASAVLHLTIGTRIPVIIADILVLVLTWRKTFRHRMEAIRVGVRAPLSALLLRDGTVYFFALLAMNIAVVLVNTVPSLQTASPVSDIIPVLTPILISRFLLNLRQLGEPESETQSSLNLRFSTPGFRVPTSTILVETMGADLDHDTAEEVDDEAEDVDVSSRNEAFVDGPALAQNVFNETQEVPRDAVEYCDATSSGRYISATQYEHIQ